VKVRTLVLVVRHRALLLQSVLLLLPQRRRSRAFLTLPLRVPAIHPSIPALATRIR